MTARRFALPYLLWTFGTAVLLISVGACSPDNRVADLKQCVAAVEKDVTNGRLPDISTTDTPEDKHDKMADAVVLCMERRGYLHDNVAMVDQRCIDDVEFNAFCYRKGK